MANEPTTLILVGTPRRPVRLSYVALLEPKQVKGKGKFKYQASVLIDKKDKALVKQILDAQEAAEKLGSAKLATMKSKMEYALKDGDIEKPDDPNYEGMYYLSAKSDNKPQIVKKGLGGKLVRITEPGEVYSGMWGIVSVNLYAYANESRGIATGLGNVVKVKDGEAFTSRTSAEEDFKELDLTELPDEDFSGGGTDEDDDFI